MKSSAKRALSLLISIAFFVAALVIYALLVRPAYSDIVKLRGAWTSKQKTFSDQEIVISKVNDLMKRYQGAANLQKIVPLSLPASENLSSVFAQLYYLARLSNAGIEVFGVQPLAIKPVKEKSLIKGLGTLRINLRLVGSYESLKAFLRGVETNLRVMDLNSLKVEAMVAAAPGLFVSNVVINTYYQP